MELDNLQKLSSVISDADLERSFLLNEQSCNVAAAMRERCNAAATLDLTNYNKTGAGSGNFVLFLRISNPRVLSDMGLAIPRPTRLLPALAGLGDPRNSLFWSVSCISVALRCGNGKLFGPLQFSEAALQFCNTTSAGIPADFSSRSFLFSLDLMHLACGFVNCRVPSRKARSVFERR
jgi:hypothetical protein